MNIRRRAVETEAIAPSSPWDLSRGREIERLNRKMRDGAWRQNPLTWFSYGERLVRWVGLNPTKLNGRIYDSRNTDPIDRYYVRFVLETALGLVEELIPISGRYLSDLDHKLALVHPNTAPMDNYAEAFAITNWGQLYTLYFPLERKKGSSDRYFDRNHGFRVLATVHELIHGFLGERYGLNIYKPSDPQSVSLALVLHELGAYTYLGQIAAKFRENTPDQSCLAGMEDYFQKTGDRLRYANQLRRRTPEAWEVDFLHRLQPYLTAFQLAGRLEKNGWTLADLPQLAIKIEKIIADELGSGYRYTLATLPTELEGSEAPVRILNRIRALKRSNP